MLQIFVCSLERDLQGVNESEMFKRIYRALVCDAVHSESGPWIPLDKKEILMDLGLKNRFGENFCLSTCGYVWVDLRSGYVVL